MMIEGTVGC
jgi:hypothetical protein